MTGLLGVLIIEGRLNCYDFISIYGLIFSITLE